MTMRLAMQIIKTSKSEIEKDIKDYFDMDGWFHFSVMQGKGKLPTIIACKNGVVLFVEVKTANEKRNPLQKRFEEKIHQAKGHYIIVQCVNDIFAYIDSITKKPLREKEE